MHRQTGLVQSPASAVDQVHIHTVEYGLEIKVLGQWHGVDSGDSFIWLLKRLFFMRCFTCALAVVL